MLLNELVILNPRGITYIVKQLPEIGIHNVIEIKLFNVVAFCQVFLLFQAWSHLIQTPARLIFPMERPIGITDFPQTVQRRTITYFHFKGIIHKNTTKDMIFFEVVDFIRIERTWPITAQNFDKFILTGVVAF